MKAHSVYLFMNRNCMVFDKSGQQIGRYQRGINCYKLNKTIARKIAREAEEFYISSYKEWFHRIDRRSFEYLLGIRTRAMDLKDLDIKKKPARRKK